MASKVNIVLDDDVKTQLEALVEAGSRSRVINSALRKELMQIRREILTGRLDQLRAKTKPTSTKEIVQRIRRGRVSSPGQFRNTKMGARIGRRTGSR